MTFNHFLMYIRRFDPSTCVHRDVWKRPNYFGVFLDVDPNNLYLGLPYALRSLRFDPSLSLVKLYKEHIGTLKAYREIESNETIVHCCQNYTWVCIPLSLWSTFVFFPSLPFASELVIVRWRIEVVEAQVGDSVSLIHRHAVRGCIYLVISDLY